MSAPLAPPAKEGFSANVVLFGNRGKNRSRRCHRARPAATATVVPATPRRDRRILKGTSVIDGTSFIRPSAGDIQGLARSTVFSTRVGSFGPMLSMTSAPHFCRRMQRLKLRVVGESFEECGKIVGAAQRRIG